MVKPMLVNLLLLLLLGTARATKWPAGSPGDDEPFDVISQPLVVSTPEAEAASGAEILPQNSGGSGCVARSPRQATSTPKGAIPLNPQCPPLPNQNVQTCTVPTFCSPTSTDPLCPASEWERYDGDAVETHFQNQPSFSMANVKQSTFSCVDARGDEPMLGTPGGDLSELMNAAMALMKITRKPYTQAIADEVFNAFTSSVATSSRPLYFHTDDASLRRMFVYLGPRLSTKKQPAILPWTGPSGTDGEAWLEALTRPEFNGCGHIRLQIDPQSAGNYSVNWKTAATSITNCAGVSATDCIDSVALGKRIIRNFFRYWWFTSSGSGQRKRVAFHVDGVLLGPLLGKAVAIVKNSPAGRCPDHAPLVRPTFGASKVFVYHPDAVVQWRTHVARNALKNVVSNVAGSGDTKMTQFITAWNDISNMQLYATLTWLRPANSIGLFQVDVPVSTGSRK